ncbi:MAG: aldehyde ferredoxin oxidoreductase family protein [Anaerolineae bacterium]|jgi:aldehyde:ferredoxin oxidoreductase
MDKKTGARETMENEIWAGRWLNVDLDTGKTQAVSVADEDVQTWLLGSGLAAHMLYETLDTSLDPLDPTSPLLVFNGLLTGTFVPAAARSSWCGRSPLTGIWNESNVGGHWGAELRFAGFDGLAITGRADAPVYLWIRDGEVEIRAAAGIWGSGTFVTHDALRDQTDRKAQVACIGPAGENQVPLAGVMTGGQAHNRAAGRGGLGALLGSKNLKAIVVRGGERPVYPDRDRLRGVVREANALIRERSEGMSMTGTAGGIPSAEHFGGMPLQNWRRGSWQKGAELISGQAIHETIRVHDTACFACPVGCGKAIEVEDGPYAGTWGEGPEYETLCGFGGNLLIDDLPALAAINMRCNDLGLDSISASGVVAFATEAMERGLISPEEADGLRLGWGEPEPVLTLLDQIADRDGVGKLLAHGVRAAATRLEPDAEAFAIHVKGMEPAYHDPRAFVDMGLNFATASRGACHLESGTYWRGYGLEWPGWQEGEYDRLASTGETVRVVVEFQNYMATYNPLGLCKFMIKGGLDPSRTTELVNAATGWDWTPKHLLQVGERLFNLKRLINLRLGITGADDTLPRRFLKEPRPSGTAAGNLPDLERLLPLYYEARGWSEDGRPTQERLEQLGIKNTARQNQREERE